MFHAIFRTCLAFGVETLRLIQLGIRTTVMLIEAVGRQGMFVSHWSGMVELACWVSDDLDIDAQSTTVPNFLIYSNHAAQLTYLQCRYRFKLPCQVSRVSLLLHFDPDKVWGSWTSFARLEFNG